MERQFLVLLIGCTLVDEEVTCNRFLATTSCFGTERKILGQKPIIWDYPINSRFSRSHMNPVKAYSTSDSCWCQSNSDPWPRTRYKSVLTSRWAWQRLPWTPPPVSCSAPSRDDWLVTDSTPAPSTCTIAIIPLNSFLITTL